MPNRCGFFVYKENFKNYEYEKRCWSYIDTLVSGSPIIQNGKLIGAVTHVLVNDPTRGYAVFAETMLDTAQSVGTKRLNDAS